MEDLIYFCGQCHSEVHRRADVCPHCNAIKGCRLTADGIVQTRGDLMDHALHNENVIRYGGLLICVMGLVSIHWFLILAGIAGFFMADPLGNREFIRAARSPEYWFRSKVL